MDEPATLDAFITPRCLCLCSACRLMGGKESQVPGSVCGSEGPKPAQIRASRGAGNTSPGLEQWAWSHSGAKCWCWCSCPSRNLSMLCRSMLVFLVEWLQLEKSRLPPSQCNFWMVPEGRTWPCLRVSSGPTQQLWAHGCRAHFGCERRVGLEMLQLMNIAVMDAQQDAAGLQHPSSLKKWCTMFASSPTPQLLSYLLLQLFFCPILFWACGACQDTCQIFAESRLWFVYDSLYSFADCKFLLRLWDILF